MLLSNNQTITKINELRVSPTDAYETFEYNFEPTPQPVANNYSKININSITSCIIHISASQDEDIKIATNSDIKYRQGEVVGTITNEKVFKANFEISKDNFDICQYKLEPNPEPEPSAYSAIYVSQLGSNIEVTATNEEDVYISNIGADSFKVGDTILNPNDDITITQTKLITPIIEEQ